MRKEKARWLHAQHRKRDAVLGSFAEMPTSSERSGGLPRSLLSFMAGSGTTARLLARVALNRAPGVARPSQLLRMKKMDSYRDCITGCISTWLPDIEFRSSRFLGLGQAWIALVKAMALPE